VSNFAHHKHDPPGEPPDHALVIASRDGCAAAFDQLVNRYFGLVYTLAFARLRDHEAAQDLAQEVFLRLFLGLPTLREPRFFATWASRVTRNLAVDWLRTRQRTSSLITLVSLEESQVEEKASEAPGAREKMLEAERLHELRNAILNLPVEQREILLLHYERGLTQQQIGARLDMHHSTVSRQLQRAVQSLRRWSTELEVLATAPARAVVGRQRERQALASTLAMLAGVSALSSGARASVTTAAAQGMARLGSVGASSGASAGASPLPVSSAGLLAKSSSIAVKGTVVTTKTKSGLVALAAVLTLGATYHQTHPGELKQLLRGTTPSTARIAPSHKPTKSFYTPTMGPGEEVFSGPMGPMKEVVIRIKRIPGQLPMVQSDAPGVLVMEYPMKVVAADGDKYIMEAVGQFGLNVTYSPTSLDGVAQMYNRRSDSPATCTVHLKRIEAPLPIGRELPPVAEIPDTQWLDQFVGEYVVSSAMKLKVTRKGDQLYVESPKQEPLPIYPMGQGRFFYRSVPEELSFYPGANGKITRMVIHAQRDTPARKVS
jgi:RNA polymerase sigma factor (sigma-70 family)